MNLKSSLNLSFMQLNKGPYSQSYVFTSSQVQMWELDHNKGWEPKNWHFWTVAGENSWESLEQQGDQTSQF